LCFLKQTHTHTHTKIMKKNTSLPTMAYLMK
jgi:hypothetical protein